MGGVFSPIPGAPFVGGLLDLHYAQAAAREAALKAAANSGSSFVTNSGLQGPASTALVKYVAPAAKAPGLLSRIGYTGVGSLIPSYTGVGAQALGSMGLSGLPLTAAAMKIGNDVSRVREAANTLDSSVDEYSGVRAPWYRAPQAIAAYAGLGHGGVVANEAKPVQGNPHRYSGLAPGSPEWRSRFAESAALNPTWNGMPKLSDPTIPPVPVRPAPVSPSPTAGAEDPSLPHGTTNEEGRFALPATEETTPTPTPDTTPAATPFTPPAIAPLDLAAKRKEYEALYGPQEKQDPWIRFARIAAANMSHNPQQQEMLMSQVVRDDAEEQRNKELRAGMIQQQLMSDKDAYERSQGLQQQFGQQRAMYDYQMQATAPERAARLRQIENDIEVNNARLRLAEKQGDRQAMLEYAKINADLSQQRTAMALGVLRDSTERATSNAALFGGMGDTTATHNWALSELGAPTGAARTAPAPMDRVIATYKASPDKRLAIARMESWLIDGVDAVDPNDPQKRTKRRLTAEEDTKVKAAIAEMRKGL